jgi:hypothetical protein
MKVAPRGPCLCGEPHVLYACKYCGQALCQACVAEEEAAVERLDGNGLPSAVSLVALCPNCAASRASGTIISFKPRPFQA